MIVPVSSLSAYEFCPRSLYLSKVEKLPPKPSVARIRGLLGHAARKELSIRQSKILSRVGGASEIAPLLREELEKVLSDVPFIYRNMLPGSGFAGYLEELRAELLRELSILEGQFGSLVGEEGLEKAIESITPWRVEYSVRSEELGLLGRIDKVMKKEVFFPVELKTGSVPDGVWEGDRLQTCAYAMLLEEEFDVKIRFGFVEYVRVFERRPVFASEKLRRKVLDARDSVASVLDGELPAADHCSERKCESCGYKDYCRDI